LASSSEGSSTSFGSDSDAAAEGEDSDADEKEGSGFYWKQSRENLFSPAGVRLFQLAYAHKDEPYESARKAIDSEYELLSPRLKQRGGTKKHGGIFATYITLLQELGLMYVDEKAGAKFLRSTSAGDQANLLLGKLPNVLRVIPYFVIELLTRYRFNNPLNTSPKNQALVTEIKTSDIFPYWSLYKIIRSVDNYITRDELALFVFKTKNMAEVPNTIERIKQYRSAKNAGSSDEDLKKQFGEPLFGAVGQPKYIIGRAGYQVGVILQEGDVYRLNPDYLPFIDQVLSEPPQFEELDENTWIRTYGRPVEAVEPQETIAEPDQEPLVAQISEDDPIFVSVKDLLFEDGYPGVILVGPPGTGKSWYARQIAIKLADGNRARLREVQFHPAYQYEDFVEGYVPDGEAGFVLRDKHLLEMAIRAQGRPDRYILVIDELSRTDPSRVFGEAMTYMERTLRGVKFYLPSGREARIPENLFFLATMNPEDRSVDDIDAAMDRRWAKVYLSPDRAVLQQFLENNGLKGAAQGAILEFFVWIQRHYKVGHAFFRTVKDMPSLSRLLNNQLLPLFEKQFRFSPDTLSEIVDSVKALQEKFQVAVALEGSVAPPVEEEAKTEAK
jgi:5-methylcytosine-specific restriction enzyme B